MTCATSLDYLIVSLARKMYDAGDIDGAKIMIDTQTEVAKVILTSRYSGGHSWMLASTREPYTPKDYKGATGALGACYKIGFKEVVVSMY